jgi:hypothetical protein
MRFSDWMTIKIGTNHLVKRIAILFWPVLAFKSGFDKPTQWIALGAVGLVMTGEC